MPRCQDLEALSANQCLLIPVDGAPTYMAEMTPTKIRGAVVSAKETVIVLGILAGYSFGNWTVVHRLHWYHLYMASAVLALPMLALSLRLPRSFRWLLLNGYSEDEVLRSMQFVYLGDTDMIRRALEPVRASFEQQNADPITGDGQRQQTSPSVWSKLRDSWTATRAATGLILLQQLSGQPSVISYSAVVFEAAGWSGNATVVTAALMLVVSSTTVALVDRIGRKKLLIACCSVLLLSALTLAVQFSADSPNRLIILSAMLMYIGGYQIGFGPITWVVVSEVFDSHLRGPATAMGVQLNYLLNFAVQFGVPVMQARLGWGRTFGIFGSVMGVAIVFIAWFVPETAGLSLEAIQSQLRPNRDGEETVASEESPLLTDQKDHEETYSVLDV